MRTLILLTAFCFVQYNYACRSCGVSLPVDPIVGGIYEDDFSNESLDHLIKKKKDNEPKEKSVGMTPESAKIFQEAESESQRP